MKKLLKSKKALSPVVAAIILIAVTVAVSIAVAAWMGSLTIGFMETSEVTITDIAFTKVTGDDNDQIVLTVSNTGTSAVTISMVKLNSATATSTAPVTLTAGQTGGTITLTEEFTTGNKYAINLFATDGTLVGSYTDTA